jgi:hypothetical protein
MIKASPMVSSIPPNKKQMSPRTNGGWMPGWTAREPLKKKGRFLNRDFAVKHEKLITKTAGNIMIDIYIYIYDELGFF